MAGHYAEIVRVLHFWFQESGPSKWFNAGAEFDRLVAERLGDCHERAARGEYDAWREAPEGCLALVILLDQIPRNIYRGTPRAYATDAKALETARYGVEKGYDQGMNDDQRAFLYLPFEHAEDMEAQRMAVRLYAGRTQNPEHLDYACRHLVIIGRFGRFPHRNVILGRESTPEEVAFLQMPGSSF